MAKIASKQLIRAGDLATLQEKLIERELGLCTTDRLLYVKYGDELIPAGDGAIPVPTSKSLFMGEEDGTSDWTSVVKAESPYDENTELWVSLDGIGFAADVAYKDAEGNPIRSNIFISPRVRPVNGHLILTNEENSHFVSVRIGDREDALGGLIPYDKPSSSDPEEQAHFSPGDLLVVDGDYGFPFLRWKHPHTFPVENSKYPVTSGAVYGVRHLIDPNLYDPNTGEELEITGTDLHYTKGWYYVFGDSLFICDSATSTKAEFTGVDGIVWALNDIVYHTPNVVVYTYDTTTNRCQDQNGIPISAADVYTAVYSGGKLPIMRIKGDGGNIIDVAYFVRISSFEATFRTLPDSQGAFTEYYQNYTASASAGWLHTDKSVGPVYKVTFDSTTIDELNAAYSSGCILVLAHVPIGNDEYIDMTMAERRAVTGGVRYTFQSSLIGNSYFNASIQTGGSWDLSNTPL